ATLHAVSRSHREATGDRVHWIRAELSDWSDVSQLVGEIEPEIIFHFGGFVTANPSISAVRPTFDTLLASTINLLTAATEKGCRRIVLPGSMMEPPLGTVDVTPM